MKHTNRKGLLHSTTISCLLGSWTDENGGSDTSKRLTAWRDDYNGYVSRSRVLAKLPALRSCPDATGCPKITFAPAENIDKAKIHDDIDSLT